MRVSNVLEILNRAFSLKSQYSGNMLTQHLMEASSSVELENWFFQLRIEL